MDQGDLAGYTELAGIRERFEAFLEPEKNATDQFLMDTLAYVKDDLQLDQDEVVKEWVDGVIGNNYPVPSRVLKMQKSLSINISNPLLYNGVTPSRPNAIVPNRRWNSSDRLYF